MTGSIPAEQLNWDERQRCESGGCGLIKVVDVPAPLDCLNPGEAGAEVGHVALHTSHPMSVSSGRAITSASTSPFAAASSFTPSLERIQAVDFMTR
jgi:hypothetical protein